MIYGDWIERWARSFPNREALVDVAGGKRFTYEELHRDICRMADFLVSRLGIGRNDRVSILAHNRREHIVLFFAASRIGAILVPLNVRSSFPELLACVKDCSPAVLFHDAEHRDASLELEQNVPRLLPVSLDGDPSAEPDLLSAWSGLRETPPAEIDLSPNDPQLILYTSGTTGRPKGAVLTHGMITWNALITRTGWDLGRSDRFLLHSSFCYTAGWNVFTLPLLHGLGTILLLRRFEADLVLEVIERERPTLFFGVPTVYRMILSADRFEQADLSSIRLAVSGGAPLPRSVLEAFLEHKGLRIREGYGLTEVGPNNFLADGPPGTVGHPMPHVDVRIVDRRDRDAPQGAEGELLIRGNHVCSGYWPPQGEASAFTPEGWFRTGDIASADERGNVSIVGRKTDMYISGGVNIHPFEIETAIQELPQVEAAAVIGVKDETWGEAGKAVVELGPGGELTLDALRASLAGRLARFKLPRYLVVVERLPRAPASGKVLKSVLRDRHGEPDNL